MTTVNNEIKWTHMVDIEEKQKLIKEFKNK